jgi:hypothetical protein
MDELHQQSVNLLSFQTLPKDVFDTQARIRSCRWIRSRNACAATIRSL